MLEDITGEDLTSRISSLSSTANYLESKLDSIKADAYTMAIVTYALQLLQSDRVDEFLSELESLQSVSDG